VASRTAIGLRRRFLPVAVICSAWFVLISGANLATPLYAVFAKHFGFSSLVLTTIFATYALVLVPALVVCGRLSDRFGRRPVILAGLCVACAGLVVFAAARSPDGCTARVYCKGSRSG
jgi:MFS family permease